MGINPKDFEKNMIFLKVKAVPEEYLYLRDYTCPCGGKGTNQALERTFKYVNQIAHDVFFCSCTKCGLRTTFLFDVSSFFGGGFMGRIGNSQITRGIEDLMTAVRTSLHPEPPHTTQDILGIPKNWIVCRCYFCNFKGYLTAGGEPDSLLGDPRMMSGLVLFGINGENQPCPQCNGPLFWHLTRDRGAISNQYRQAITRKPGEVNGQPRS